MQARAAALKPYFSTLGVDADGKMGWNGKGTQRAENPTVMRVQVLDESTARVLVVVDVVRGETRTTTGLEMTVKVIDGAAAVGDTADDRHTVAKLVAFDRDRRFGNVAFGAPVVDCARTVERVAGLGGYSAWRCFAKLWIGVLTVRAGARTDCPVGDSA